jgi:hypothetical protein
MNLRQIIDWLTTSSADPERTSSTIKGILKVGAAQVIHTATVACSVGVACAFGDLSWLNGAADLLGLVAYGVLILWGAGQGFFGLWRKVRLGRWAHPDVLPL